MIVLKDLGITPERLQELVVDRLCEQFMVEKYFDYNDDDGREQESTFSKGIKALVKGRIDAKINELAENYVLPTVAEYVERLTLQQTNQWGEKRGEPMSFIEYLIARAEAYMTEKVNYDGKGRTEANGYSWSGTQTRVTFLVNRHLHSNIEAAMKLALTNANSQIVNGIQEAVKLKLGELAASLKVSATLK